MTTGIMDAAMIPYYVNTDEEAVKTCIHSLYSTEPKDARIVHIKNTLCLETIQVSTALYEAIKDMPGISYVSGPEPMKFDSEGMMD